MPMCPIDAEQVLDSLRKKNAADQPLPPNNIIEFNLGGYDVEILKGTFIFYISGHELIFQKYGFKKKKNLCFIVHYGSKYDIKVASMVY